MGRGEAGSPKSLWLGVRKEAGGFASAVGSGLGRTVLGVRGWHLAPVGGFAAPRPGIAAEKRRLLRLPKWSLDSRDPFLALFFT